MLSKVKSLLHQKPSKTDNLSKINDSGKTPSISTFHDDHSSNTGLEGDKLFEVYTPGDGHRTEIDIVAVHGLMGHPYHTWTKGRDPNGTPWIMDFLPSELPTARVFSYGYDSKFVSSSSVAGIPHFAMNLLAWLKLKRCGEQRPLLFICHSLGGIVVKKALIIAHNRKDEELLKSIQGIAFLGVPHMGSGVVELGKYIAFLLRSVRRNTNADLLADLDTKSKVLNNICIDSVHLLCQLQILTFFETRNFPKLGRLIVDESSARLNSHNEEVIPINADHSNICKFAYGDANCELVGGLIVALGRKIMSIPAPAEDSYVAVLSSPQPSAIQRPRLTIHSAMWGERDVKSTLISRIKEDQTLEIDTRYDIDTGDPWYLVHKVTTIIYSYEGQALQLLVTHDGAGVFLIHFERVEPVLFWNAEFDRTLTPVSGGQGMEILAVIWGCMLNQGGPISQSVMDKMYETQMIECSNDFFGFDGYPMEHKTCQVFYRMREHPGTVRCHVAREHSSVPLKILS